MKLPNDRFRVWYDTLKALNIYPTKNGLYECLLTRNGNPVSQSQVSMIRKGVQAFRESHAEAISDYFFFTPKKFFTDKEVIIDVKKLIKWCLKKIGKTQKELAKEITLTESQISYLNNLSDPRDLQLVFDYLNKELDFRLSAEEINQANNEYGYLPFYRLMKPMVRRLKEVEKYYIQKGAVNDTKDFCRYLDVNEAQYSRLSHSKGTLEVSRDFIVKVADKCSEVNMRWFLTGKGTPFVHTNSADKFAELEAKLEAISRKIASN